MFAMIAALALAGGDTVIEVVKKEDPVICKRDNTLATGSHFQSKRVCKPKSEWEYMEKYTQEQLRKIDDRRKRIPNTSGMGGRGPGR